MSQPIIARRLLLPAVMALSLCCAGAHAQFSRHLVRFSDKRATPFSLGNPSAYLSAKSLERRRRQSIGIDSTDLPVCRAYLDSIASLRNVRIINSSRWLNQAVVQTTDNAALQRIAAFPFVRSSRPVAARNPAARDTSGRFRETVREAVAEAPVQARGLATQLDYGYSRGQIILHEGEYLHDRGFRGEGMTVAMLDAGYFGYLTNPALDSLRRNGRVLGAWDFVREEARVDEDDTHGLYCLSIMAADRPGVLVGSAPKASYYLFRTEDAGSEYPVEEHFWAVAAERADSLGADLITSSLGYTDFDDASFDYRYADMNGRTTMVTRAADMAAAKGMIVTNSAGNSGNSSWRYIVAPADGDSVLAVGATDVNGQVAGFSSHGPSADGRVKPDVASVGAMTFLANINGSPAQGSGTSFSNPNMAGLVVCLWQAFPEFSNMEVLDAVKRSASRYSNPDTRVGYGIPNMRLAYESLLRERRRREALRILGDRDIRAYPTPFSDRLNIVCRAPDAGVLHVEMIDVQGRVVAMQERAMAAGEVAQFEVQGAARLPAGAYLLRYRQAGRSGTIRLLK